MTRSARHGGPCTNRQSRHRLWPTPLRTDSCPAGYRSSFAGRRLHGPSRRGRAVCGSVGRGFLGSLRSLGNQQWRRLGSHQLVGVADVLLELLERLALARKEGKEEGKEGQVQILCHTWWATRSRDLNLSLFPLFLPLSRRADARCPNSSRIGTGCRHPSGVDDRER